MPLEVILSTLLEKKLCFVFCRIDLSCDPISAAALVTVDYTAGVNGYAETRSKEAGKVTMKAVPAWDGPLAGLEEPSGAISVAKGATSSSSRFGSSSGSRSSSAIRSSSSQSDLIAQILAALTPQINSAVAAALA